jgi:hypothetical protein
MSLCFVQLFEKYLRTAYMLVTLREGRMDDIERYVRCKNVQHMYFSEYVNSRLK